MDKYIKSLLETHQKYILGRLLPFVAHEINNFITSISGYSQMALSMKREEVFLKSIQKNEEMCIKIREFTKNIFEISKKDFEKLNKGLPHESIKLCEKIYGYHLKKRNITLKISGECKKPVNYSFSLLNLYIFTLLLDSESRFLKKDSGGEIQIEISQDEKTKLSYFDNSDEKSSFMDFYPSTKLNIYAEPQIGWLALYKIAELHMGNLEKKFHNGNNIILTF